ncbi:hypothetical protein ACFE04_020003 [Oxalis oulophora]
MKRMDIFCASQASTAICMSMDHHNPSSSSSSSAAAQLGGRAIDRYNPIIRDGRRITTNINIPCTSQVPSPINPKPYHLLNDKYKKPSSSLKIDDDNNNNNNKSTKHSDLENAKKKKKKKYKKDYESKENVEFATKKRDFVAPPADSSRYLLSDTAFVDGLLSDYDFIKPPPPLLTVENKEDDSKIVTNSNAIIHAKSSSSSARLDTPVSNQVNSLASLSVCKSEFATIKENIWFFSQPQVVVLRVSLHCKGCAGKVKKHLSKMEGVKSYNIDFAAKKVTIVGDVTPASVLASVSKVKNAQFWPESSNVAPPSNQNQNLCLFTLFEGSSSETDAPSSEVGIF